MPLPAPMPATDAAHALCTPSRIQKDFRVWLWNNKERLKIDEEELEWYARQMEVADEFGWKCVGASKDMTMWGQERVMEYCFTWHNQHSSSVSGAWETDVYAAFLSSLQARRRFLRDGR